MAFGAVYWVYLSANAGIALALLLTILAVLVIVQPVQPSHVRSYWKNPDLDLGVASPSYWWTYSSINETVFSWQQADGINDSRYVRVDKYVTSGSATWAQGVEANGEVRDYRVTAYVKGEFTNMGSDGGFYLGVECWSENWTYLGCLDSPHITTNVDNWTLTSLDGHLFENTHHISVTLNMRDCAGWVGWDNATFVFLD
jgi:hypothetical protein